MDTFTPSPNYLLKVTILYTEDPIVMRQISVPAGINLHDLHLILQTAFGWGQCHPYKFGIEKRQKGGERCEWLPIFGSGQGDSLNLVLHSPKFYASTLFSKVLGDAQQNNKTIVYIYDVENGWNHSIELVGRTTESTETAACVSGEGHPCAEDVGGSLGWKELKLAYKKLFDKSDIRANKRRKWYKDDCMNGDPKGLADKGPYRWDHEAVNKELAQLKLGQYVEEEEEEEEEEN